LQSLDVDIHPVFVPRPCSKTVGYESCEDSVEVEEEEQSSEHGQVYKSKRAKAVYLQYTADEQFNKEDPE
jgi:hypothetical protein